MVKLNINGADHELDIDPQMPLLWALRDHLDMTGTKFGCGQALCGACTVHLDGQPVRSCQTFVGDVGEGKITTIEGVSGKVAEAVRAAWTKLDVVQCGYCQSGQIMSAIGLLEPDAEADRRRHRLGDGRQHLPLRHLSAHPRRDPRRRVAAGLNRRDDPCLLSQSSPRPCPRPISPSRIAAPS